MKEDPNISAVRETRHRISESVGHDPKKLVEYYRQRQERHQDRLASSQPPGSEPDPHATSVAE